MSKLKSKITLLEVISALIRREHYSLSTERTYCVWVRQFVKFHHMQTREILFVEQEKKVEDFLNYLALERNVAASTQNQAFNALVTWKSFKLLGDIQHLPRCYNQTCVDYRLCT